VQFANGQFIAVGDNGYLATSPDGVIWTEHRTYCQNTLRSVLYAESRIILAGNNETLLQSEFFGLPVLHVRRSLGIDGFQFMVDGQIGSTFRLQASDDLVNWEDIFTFTNTRVSTLFLDSEATAYGRRFYRVVSP
jgi:hypothetical protein